MHRYIVVAILGTCCIASGPASAFPSEQSKALSASATIDVTPGQRAVVVHLRNRSDLSLEAWDLLIQYDSRTGSHNSEEQGTDTASDEAPPGTPGRGAILPGDTRDVRYVLDEHPLRATVAIKMLVFADGTVEGAADRAKTLFNLRDHQAEVLGIWIHALSAASGGSVHEARAVLQRTLDSEAQHIRTTPDYAGKSAYDRINSLLESSDDVLMSQIAEVKQRLERVHERETRHRSRR